MIAEFPSSESSSPTIDTQSPSSSNTSNTETGASSSSPAAKQLSELKTVEKLKGIPVVVDGLGGIENIVKSTQITSSLYAIGGGLAARSLDLASPLIVRGQPLIAKADGLVVQSLDIIESKFPYPFQASTNDIVSSTKNMYDQQMAGILHNEIVQRALVGVNELKEKLSATGQYAASHVHAIAAGIVDQLYQIVGSKDLPNAAKENIGAVYNDLKKITSEGDKTTQQKAGEIVAYVQTKVQPELEKLSGLVFKQKEEAEKKAAEVKAEGETKADEAAQKIDEATS